MLIIMYVISVIVMIVVSISILGSIYELIINLWLKLNKKNEEKIISILDSTGGKIFAFMLNAFISVFIAIFTGGGMIVGLANLTASVVIASDNGNIVRNAYSKIEKKRRMQRRRH